MRKYIFGGLLIGGLIFIAGCGTAPASAPVPPSGNSDQAGQGGGPGNGFGFASSTDRGFNRGVAVSSTELLVGKKVVVSGVTNSDGTVTARMIIIGDMPFGLFRTSTRPTSTRPTSTNWNGRAAGNGGPSAGGERMMGSGGQRNGTGTTRTGGMRRRGAMQAAGEIVKKDDTSLILKDANGGSRIVFYSASTQIFLAPTNTPSGRPMPLGVPGTNTPDTAR